MSGSNRKPSIKVYVDNDVIDLMPDFLENRAKDISRIKRALEKGDFDSISSIGHNMKGSGGSYGLTMISELGRQIEVAARQKDVEALKWLTEKLNIYLNDIEILKKNDN